MESVNKIFFSVIVGVALLMISVNSLTYGDDVLQYDVCIAGTNDLQNQLNASSAVAVARNVTGIKNLNFTIIGGTNFGDFVADTITDVTVLQSLVSNISSSVLQDEIITLNGYINGTNSTALYNNIITLQGLVSTSSAVLRDEIITLQGYVDGVSSINISNNITYSWLNINNINNINANNTVAIENIENLTFTSPNIPLVQQLIIGNNNSTNRGGVYPCIGDNYLGGIVFYVDNATSYGDGTCGSNGLIAAVNNISGVIAWDWHVVSGNNFTVVGALANGIGGGMSNTRRITTTLGVNQTAPSTTVYAAQYCGVLNVSNYSSWYLPSLTELNLAIENIPNISSVNELWSSDECLSDCANCSVHAGPGCNNVAQGYVVSHAALFSDLKNNPHNVMCIKKFN